MKTEYFMQVKVAKKDEESELLERIVESFGKKVEYYTLPDMIALSMDAGMCAGYLKLSPMSEPDSITGEDIKWYMFRITDIEPEVKYDSLDQLASGLKSLTSSKVGDVTVGRVYRVTATDVPWDFRMIRKEHVYW